MKKVPRIQGSLDPQQYKARTTATTHSNSLSNADL
jgi:hypothetical protein